MRKFINPSPIPNGGMPLFGSDMIDILQTDIYRAITATYLQYSEPVIINGCTVVANMIASTLTITAGMAFINGDIVDVPSYAGAFPVYLCQDNNNVTSKVYKDKQTRPVIIEKVLKWANAAPDTGDYITFDPYTSQYLRDVKRRYETPINQLVPFVDYPDANCFDGNGVGKWAWKGFALPNGYAGLTFDLRGRALVHFNPGDIDFDLHNTPGAKTHTNLITEIPAHVHGMFTNGTQHSLGTPGPTDQIAFQGDYGGNPYAYQMGSLNGTPNVGVTGSTGGDPTIGGAAAPHNNIQPSFGCLYLQRIAV